MRRRIAALLGIFIGIGIAWIPAAAAGRPVHEVLSANPDGEVSIEIVSGSVRFIGWERNEVQIEGTLDEDVEGLDIDSGGSHISIEVDLVDSSGRLTNADAHLEIHVPAGSRIEAESVSADISVESTRGRVDIESVNGDVEVRGDVTEADISTVSSRVVIQSDAAFRNIGLETVSGNIDFSGRLDRGARFDAESVSGDVVLRLDSSTSAEFRVETFSGDIDNELGPPAQKSGPYVPAKTLSFSLGSGDARVDIESFSGRVRLLPR